MDVSRTHVKQENKIERGQMKRTTKKKLFFTTVLGLALVATPAALVFLDPVMLYAKYMLRLDNGTMLHELMQRPFQDLKVSVYLFNVTNAGEFLNGTDSRVKIQEVGPFVFREMRTNEDIVINEENKTMWFTPKMKPIFIPEESVADLRDVQLIIPNFPLQYITSIVSKYPYLVQQIFNYIVSQSRSEPFNKMTAHDALWGREDPLIHLANKYLPGLVYFESFGMMSRLYDFEYDYRLEVGTTNLDKFALKRAVRINTKDNPESKTFDEKTLLLPNDTYEGEVFPPDLKPDQNINIYRPSVCRTFQFRHISSRRMFYGGNAFVYKLSESTLNDHENCFTNGWCPGGLMNIAPCYWGIPVVLSKGHLLDADPRLRDLVEGFKPDRNIHDGELLVDPKVGVAVKAYLSIQVNMFLSDVAYNPQTRRLQDIVMPTVHYILKSPPLIEEALNALQFVYTDGPRILLTVQVGCALLGLCFLAYSARLLYLNWLASKNLKNEDFSKSHRPLLTTRKSVKT